MRPAAILVAAAPLAAALGALIATAVTGFDQRAILPVELGNRFYGFFLDRYPLYAFTIVYGLARILAAACAPGAASVARRIVGSLVGLALVLAVSLHPTFGGIVLRGGFATGGMAFLNQVPMLAAYALGAAVVAVLFGSAMGAGVLLANPGIRTGAWGWRMLARGALSVGSRYLLLWYAFVVLGFARQAGLGPWPHRSLDIGDAILAGLCLLLALLPHALLVAARTDRRDADRDG